MANFNFLSKLGREYEKEHSDFLASYPQYLSTLHIDRIRKKEFKRLDKVDHVYLDFTGGNLYSERLIDEHHAFLKENILGNPHSINPTSSFAEKKIEETRKAVKDYFNAGDDYVCVFTSNASGALKIIANCYPFQKGDQYLLTVDNHNSVNGIREKAIEVGAEVNYCSVDREELCLDEENLMKQLSEIQSENNKLFAFPAQSNSSGMKHDLSWVNKAKENGWDVLLDAAAFVPTNSLDLQEVPADLVSLSFYKIFGYPTGLGCLFIRKNIYNKLSRKYFAGGTVSVVSVAGNGYFLHDGHARFEDGTLNYLDIPAIKNGLDYISEIGMEVIQKRLHCLSSWLMKQLQNLRHENGSQLIHIYGGQKFINRGSTFSMNFFDPVGTLYQYYEIEELAANQNISLRAGCFCNPGLDEISLQVSSEKLKKYFCEVRDISFRDFIDYIGEDRGSVRVSLGYINNFRDVLRLVKFAKGLLNVSRAEGFNQKKDAL